MTARAIVAPIGDTGDVSFAVDVAAGVVNIGIRPPFALESARVTGSVTLLDFLDKAAELTLELNRLHRQLLARAGGMRA